MADSLNEFSEEIANHYVSYIISSFEVFYAMMSGFSSALLLLSIHPFTALHLAPWILFAMYLLMATYMIRFVVFGYRMLIYLWKNLRPPYNPDEKSISLPFLQTDREFQLGAEVTSFAILVSYVSMLIWSVIAFAVVRYLDSIVGFLEFSFNFVPSQVSSVGVSIIVSLVGLGGTTDSVEQLGPAGAVEAVLWIPIVVLGVLVCWNAMYSIEASHSNRRGVQPFPSKSGLQQLQKPAKTFISTALDVCEENGRRFLKQIMIWSLIFLASLTVVSQF